MNDDQTPTRARIPHDRDNDDRDEMAASVQRRQWLAPAARSMAGVSGRAAQPGKGCWSAWHTVPGAGATRSTRYFTRAASMQALGSLSLTWPGSVDLLSEGTPAPPEGSQGSRRDVPDVPVASLVVR